MKCKNCKGFGETVHYSRFTGPYRLRCSNCEGTGKLKLNWPVIAIIAFVVLFWGLMAWALT